MFSHATTKENTVLQVKSDVSQKQDYLVALGKALNIKNLHKALPQVILKKLAELDSNQVHAKHPITRNTLLLDALDPRFNHKNAKLRFLIIKTLLEKGSDANAINDQGQSALYLACHSTSDLKNFKSEIKLLLEYKANMFEKNQDGQNILNVLYWNLKKSIKLSDKKLIFLLNQNHDLNLQDFRYLCVFTVIDQHANNVLHAIVKSNMLQSDTFFDVLKYCVETNQADIAQLILKKHASSLAHDEVNRLLMHSLKKKHFTFLQMVLNSTLYKPTRQNLLLLVLMAFESEQLTIITFILERFDIDFRKNFSENKNLSKVSDTNDSPPDPFSEYIISKRYDALLEKIVRQDQDEVFTIMLNYGLDVNYAIEIEPFTWCKKINLFTAAIFQKSSQMIRSLRIRGATLNPSDSAQITQFALKSEDQEIFNLYIKYSAADNKTVIDDSIGTLPHAVIQYVNTKSTSNELNRYWPIRSLISYGLWEEHPTIKFYGKTPLELANTQTKKYIGQLTNRLDCGKTIYGFKTRSAVLRYFQLEKNSRVLFKSTNPISIFKKNGASLTLPTELTLLVLEFLTGLSNIDFLFFNFTTKTLQFRKLAQSCEALEMEHLTPWGLK